MALGGIDVKRFKSTLLSLIFLLFLASSAIAQNGPILSGGNTDGLARNLSNLEEPLDAGGLASFSSALRKISIGESITTTGVGPTWHRVFEIISADQDTRELKAAPVLQLTIGSSQVATHGSYSFLFGKKGPVMASDVISTWDVKVLMRRTAGAEYSNPVFKSVRLCRDDNGVYIDVSVDRTNLSLQNPWAELLSLDANTPFQSAGWAVVTSAPTVTMCSFDPAYDTTKDLMTSAELPAIPVVLPPVPEDYIWGFSALGAAGDTVCNAAQSTLTAVATMTSVAPGFYADLGSSFEFSGAGRLECSTGGIEAAPGVLFFRIVFNQVNINQTIFEDDQGFLRLWLRNDAQLMLTTEAGEQSTGHTFTAGTPADIAMEFLNAGMLQVRKDDTTGTLLSMWNPPFSSPVSVVTFGARRSGQSPVQNMVGAINSIKLFNRELTPNAIKSLRLDGIQRWVAPYSGIQ